MRPKRTSAGRSKIAANHSVRSEELRSSLCLAQLLAKEERRDEARRIIAGTYGWFTEGFDVADLKDAKALLNELAG